MIVVFDSGIGGKTLVTNIKKKLPSERVVFVSDSEHCPYGEKSVAQIRKLVLARLKKHLDQNPAIVVIACNTATVAAIDWLRKEYPNIKFVGMVPALKPAVAFSKTKTIAVLATPLTVKSNKYKQLIQQFTKGFKVYSIGAKGLAKAIENSDKKLVDRLLKRYLSPLKQRKVDVIVLGCTHYLLVKSAIQDMMGKGVILVDSNEAVVNRVNYLIQLSHGS